MCSVTRCQVSRQSLSAIGRCDYVVGVVDDVDIISGAREGTIVDGVNLDEIREFAKQFKIRRLSLGLTQTQVGQALSATEGPSYSQSAICRYQILLYCMFTTSFVSSLHSLCLMHSVCLVFFLT